MADNFDFTEGSGKTGSADDVGGVLYPRVKLDIGTDGVGTPVLGGAGAVAAGVPRITLASDDPAVALLTTIDSDTNTIQSDTTSIDGKITACNTGAVVISSGIVTTVSTVTNLAQLGGTAITMDEGVHDAGTQRVTLATDDDGVLSLGIMDDWDESDRAKVNPIVGQAGVQGAEGTITALTQRVTLATDDDGVAHLATIAGDTTSIDGNITACNTGAVVLASGTVDTVTNLAQMGGAALDMNEGVLGVGTQRVSLATDDDAVAYLATIAGDTTSIDGNITACNTGAVVISSGTVTTVSTVTSLSQLGGQAINLGEGTISTGTQRITLATDDDAVASLGIIDDWDAVHASAASSDGPQVMGAGYSTGLPTDVGADGDAARICTDRHGRIVRGLMPQWFNAIYNSADASGEGETVKAATASRKIYILSLTISVDAEMWVELQDEDSNAITCKHWFKAGGGKTITYPPEAPLVLDVVNKALEVITEGAGNIGVEITGYLAV